MSKRLRASGSEKSPSPEEQRAKINDVKKMIGALADKFPALCSDASILRYLRARNWSVKKAAKMLKETLKWRLEFKPEKLQWEDIAHEAETGKIYKANYFDKKGRTVIVVRPGFQNTSAVAGQIKHLVYCVENAILTMNPDQEQMTWLVDFQWWTMACISVKAARDTLKILQDHYPERLGVAILYNPPKVFESFWTMMKPFIEPKTYKKVNFVYSNKPQSRKIMEEIFDMDKLESTFGGRNSIVFDYEAYGLRMKQEDKKFSDLNSSESALPMLSITLESQHSDSLIPNEDSSSSTDEDTSNLELDLDEETQDQPCNCKDDDNDDAAEVGPDKETEDQPCSCKNVGNGDAAEVVKELK
ncbi:phosphatidylinositol transfer protein 3 isoform X2 [Ricinus communis]|nr:phosphatidylinositol transfer protein 3 isoform X2 [Ricinus communis]